MSFDKQPVKFKPKLNLISKGLEKDADYFVEVGLDPSNFYLGGSAYNAPRPSVVPLRRNSRPAARQQRHCATRVFTAQGPRLPDLRRIRVRCVRCVTKVLSAAEAAIMSFLQDLSSLSSEPDSFALIDIQSSRK